MENYIKSEINSMKKFIHGNIIQFIDGFKDNNKYYIVMEYCDIGDFRKFIEHKRKNGGIDLNVAIFYTI